jgi:histidinol dehydrogenase
MEEEKMRIVKTILKDVKNKGDLAVKKYTARFDKVELRSLEVSKKAIARAYNKVDKTTLNALKKAAKNIKYFAKQQLKSVKSFEIKKNKILLGQKIIPLQRVGCYVPGGRYPLPSSALMSIIPARVAGVKEIIICSPKIKPITIVAADLSGADRIFRVGGIQAIAAMAYGTKTIPKVDKIVGPGNKFVAAAKKEVFGSVGIDCIAGPSEIMIIADNFAKPEFIAADLIAQAEHDPDAKVTLVTTSQALAKKVDREMKIQLKNLSTKEIAKEALKNRKIRIVKTINNAIEVANAIAPEHLELMIRNPKSIVNKLKNYGSLFLGNYSAEVFGDYCSGPNHILPTNQAAKYTGGLSIFDFIKIVTTQQMTKQGAKKLIKNTAKLAEIEGLEGHKKAALIRD